MTPPSAQATGMAHEQFHAALWIAVVQLVTEFFESHLRLQWSQDVHSTEDAYDLSRKMPRNAPERRCGPVRPERLPRCFSHRAEDRLAGRLNCRRAPHFRVLDRSFFIPPSAATPVFFCFCCSIFLRRRSFAQAICRFFPLLRQHLFVQPTSYAP